MILIFILIHFNFISFEQVKKENLVLFTARDSSIVQNLPLQEPAPFLLSHFNKSHHQQTTPYFSHPLSPITISLNNSQKNEKEKNNNNNFPTSTTMSPNIFQKSLFNVTKIIHQTWKVHELPPRFKKWSLTWKSCFPDWQYILWSDEDNRNLLVKYYPQFVEMYDGLPGNIYRSDVMRYFYMHHYGGIYADLDDECLKPFGNLLENYNLVFGAMEGQYGVYLPEGYVQNSFFYSQSKHPFWMNLLEEIKKRNSGPPEFRTGPVVLGFMINKNRATMSSTWKIYSSNYFNPFSWLKNTVLLPGQCKDLNRMSDEELQACREHFVKLGSYVVQYHSQTWGRGKILRRR